MATNPVTIAADQASAFLRSMCCALSLAGVPAPADDERGPEADAARLEAILLAHEIFALALAAEKRRESAEILAGSDYLRRHPEMVEPDEARPRLRIVRNPGVPVDGRHRFPLALVPLEELPERAAELLAGIFEAEHGEAS